MRWWMLAGTALLASQVAAQEAAPPRAAKKPFQVTSPNGARADDYYWLRDDTRKNPEILAYLKAENAYADARLAALKPLEAKLYAEAVGHIKQDDSSVPYPKKGWWYGQRFATGADYPLIERRRGSADAPAVIMFDQPAMAKGKSFFALSDWSVSPDNRLVAWAEDTVGRRQYVLRAKDLATGRVFDDVVSNVEPNVVWADDNRTLFYVAKDPVTLRGYRVMAHSLGTPVSADRLVYEEKDDTFSMSVGRTTDDRYVCITVSSTVSDEQRCAPAAAPTSFAVIAPRAREFRYGADHQGGRWIIRTNRGARNYKLVTLADADAAKGVAGWRDLTPASETVFIEGFKPFAGFVAIDQREGGNRMIRLLTGAGRSIPVKADEPAYRMALSVNEEPGTPWVRYTYGSLVTPTTTYEVNATTGERRTLKVTPVPGYDPASYVTERVWATARDGTRVPVSLVYRKGVARDGTAPLFQYAYGSYGISSDPSVDPGRIPMLDRGVVYAIAHIRGGQEMGRGWYDDGHLLNKKNSFTDFIDVTRYLVARKYAAKGRVAAMGGSAGGLLMGGVANMAPQDYKVIVAQVPFVDVVTTMLDASIPLTTFEYDEWGNPAQKPYYDYMLSYSPYDNVSAKTYPALYVGTGLWDSQVQYYEPAKWVAKLRELKTDTNPLLFRVNMEAGHGGKSGRFERMKQNAEWQAFVLSQLGVAN
ncbi:oligopeptidase B [Sphingomonas jinjuensis]|uniref:Oligopeptidase B n=1 Tax=Sphingomonas jinjuensis TaxID=535907 RepID=A0A840FL12_9SPHN|nr:S9 family peptidase [Sphingomonas jinjuensis]MBB4154005.1 oligopeptidase B [Sphingomonas jinjuensis]